MEIPLDLQAFIKSEIGWEYNQRRNDARCCGNLTKSEYMGTYFPRSFVESYKIFDLLLQNQFIREALNQKNELNVLDIGSGIGGNLLGLLWFLKDQGYFNAENDNAIYLRSIDGDKESLEIQRKLLDHFFDQGTAADLVPNLFESSEGAIAKLNEVLTFQNQKYEIIMCSKFVNEFYTCEADYERNNGLYSGLIGLVENFLTEDGLIILTDVTTPLFDGHSRWLPEIMCQEIWDVISEPNCGLSHIQPLSCAFFQSKCSEPHRCFPQITYNVKHSCLPHENWQDYARICFKVLTTIDFANHVLRDETAQRGYIIAKKQDNNINTCVDKNFYAVNISNDADSNSRHFNDAYGGTL